MKVTLNAHMSTVDGVSLLHRCAADESQNQVTGRPVMVERPS
jgi:hypothetical protein